MAGVCSGSTSACKVAVCRSGPQFGASYYKQALSITIYRVILSVPDPRKCEYLKDCSLDFEHACMTTYLAS